MIYALVREYYDSSLFYVVQYGTEEELTKIAKALSANTSGIYKVVSIEELKNEHRIYDDCFC